ncbi:MAG TPA: alpha/beta fold hydrolase [Chitinophagaceae bacterium]|nr:alpha/beta fold hydrolase [Chitinophagaceae bacterium]
MKTYLFLILALLGKHLLYAQEAPLSADFTISRNKTTLYGTLVKPAAARKKVPVVLLITGTGQMNRNLNLGLGRGSDAYKMLADSFASAGIASVRFDKRGVGASAAALKHDSLLRFEDHILDVVACLEKIRQSKQFGPVYLVGHSEGALVALIVANRVKVQGVVCMETLGERSDIALGKQLNKNTPGKPTEVDTILSQIRAGHRVKVQNKYLITVFRPSIQPYMSSLFSYDPREEIKKIKVPVLLINGTNDLQVPADNVQLLQQANPAVAVRMIPRMNYMLKEVPEELEVNVASYNDPSLPISAALVQEIIRFCRSSR